MQKINLYSAVVISLTEGLIVSVGDDENRWMKVGRALRTVVEPALRPRVKEAMDSLYVHQQTTCTAPEDFRINQKQHLHYQNIKGTKTAYTINSSFELARLFIQPKMAKPKSFEECDLSVLLGLVIYVEDAQAKDFFKNVRTEAELVRDIRNEWAHHILTEWDEGKFENAFLQMEKLVQHSDPSLKASLEETKTKGLYYCETLKLK